MIAVYNATKSQVLQRYIVSWQIVFCVWMVCVMSHIFTVNVISSCLTMLSTPKAFSVFTPHSKNWGTPPPLLYIWGCSSTLPALGLVNLIWCLPEYIKNNNINNKTILCMSARHIKGMTSNYILFSWSSWEGPMALANKIQDTDIMACRQGPLGGLLW